MREKWRAFWSRAEIFLAGHLLAFQVALVAGGLLVPVCMLAMVRLFDHPLLSPGYWLWLGWWSAILMMRYWRWWKRALMQILMVILVPINMLMCAVVLLVSTMGGIWGVLLGIAMIITPIGPVLLLLNGLKALIF